MRNAMFGMMGPHPSVGKLGLEHHTSYWNLQQCKPVGRWASQAGIERDQGWSQSDCWHNSWCSKGYGLSLMCTGLDSVSGVGGRSGAVRGEPDQGAGAQRQRGSETHSRAGR